MEGRRRREYCWICRRGTVHIFTHTLQEDVATGEYALCEACQPARPHCLPFPGALLAPPRLPAGLLDVHRLFLCRLETVLPQ